MICIACVDSIYGKDGLVRTNGIVVQISPISHPDYWDATPLFPSHAYL